MPTSSLVDPYDEELLRHMAEPSAPSEREDATSVGFDLVRAALLRSMLQEWGSQPKIEQERSHIALGYARRIDEQMQRGKSYVTLYVHTGLAAQVLSDVLYDEWDDVPSKGELLRDVEENVIEAWGDHHNDEREEYDGE